MTSEVDNYLGRDPFSYCQERERFIKDLFHFHINRKTQFLDVPKISGKPVDLFLLYSLVTKYGGFHKISDKNQWPLISTSLFHLPDGCANAELALKQIYMRYLYVYERVNVHGDDPDVPEDDEAVGPSGSKSNGRILVHQVPVRYDYRQHKISTDIRDSIGLSTNFCKPNAYERLEKSLISGLPNEVDFAINICCILSMELQESLKLLTHRRLIDILLANVGLFLEGSDLSNLYHEEWYPRHRQNFTRFWYETIDCEDLEYGSQLLDMMSAAEYRISDQNFYSKKTHTCGHTVLHLGRSLHSYDSILHRVQQVVSIMRNLSHDSSNAQALAESDLALNFTLLCCHSSLPQIRRDGMDILVNLCQKYTFSAITSNPTKNIIIRCLHSWLFSQDKLDIVSALNVLSALAQVEANEDTIVDCLTTEAYNQIVTLARVYDLQLIIASLDALYYLSEIGEASCEGIAMVKHCIDFLIDLLTVETLSFGEAALGGIRVADHGQARVPQQGPHQPQLRPVMGPPATPGFSNQQLSRPGTPHNMNQRPPLPQSIAPPPSISPSPLPQPPPSQQYRQIQPKPPSGLTAPSQRPALLPATPQNLALMNPEQVACNWLRANYEPHPGFSVAVPTIYQDYVVWLQRRASQSAVPVNTAQFMACSKKVFPYSSSVANGSDCHISGIRWKPPQVPGSHPAGTHPAGTHSVGPHSADPHPAGLHPGGGAVSGVTSSASNPPPYTTGHPANQSVSNPVPNSSPSSDVLRSMLRSPTNASNGQRPRSDSMASNSTPTTKTKSSRGRGSRNKTASSCSPTRPSSRLSTSNSIPTSSDLQICGPPERIEDCSASITRIERVENIGNDNVTATKINSNQINTSLGNQHNNQHVPAGDLITAKHASINGVGDLSAENSQVNNDVENTKDDCDSAMDTTEHRSDTTVGSKLENGKSTPTNDGTSSPPPLCNGNHSDNDSLLAESSRDKIMTNGKPLEKGDGDGLGKTPVHLNGFINNIEKMLIGLEGSRNGNHLNSKPPSTEESEYKKTSPSPFSPVSETCSQICSNEQTVCHAKDNNFSNNFPHNDKSTNSDTDKASLKCNTDSHDSNSCVSSPKAPSVASLHSSTNTSRKRRHSSSQSDKRPDSASTPDTNLLPHKCLWEECAKAFATCSLLRRHVSEEHTMKSGACRWTGCDNIERMRWALVSHVSERHTNDIALNKALSNREKQIQTPVVAPPPPAIYTANAARIAIFRNAPKPPYPDLQDAREGPVTKHIRFTAALILRNLSRYSSTGRTLLKKHESHLAYIAGSTMEAAGAILNCLIEMQQAQHL